MCTCRWNAGLGKDYLLMEEFNKKAGKVMEAMVRNDDFLVELVFEMFDQQQYLHYTAPVAKLDLEDGFSLQSFKQEGFKKFLQDWRGFPPI